jgi:hypothetical protein
MYFWSFVKIFYGAASFFFIFYTALSEEKTKRFFLSNPTINSYGWSLESQNKHVLHIIPFVIQISKENLYY